MMFFGFASEYVGMVGGRLKFCMSGRKDMSWMFAINRCIFPTIQDLVNNRHIVKNNPRASGFSDGGNREVSRAVVGVNGIRESVLLHELIQDGSVVSRDTPDTRRRHRSRDR